MTMPVMEPDVDATLLRNWARAIDEGPLSSLRGANALRSKTLTA